MSKEQQLFNLATTTSNAFGIKSELAGYEATKFEGGEGANIGETQDEFAGNVLSFAEILTNSDVADVHPHLGDDELEEARELIVTLQNYDADKLEHIARQYWDEQEAEAAA